MSRYITASKLAQLVLLGVYIRGKVPNDALVAVLAFVSARLHHYSATASKASTPPAYRSAPATIDDFLNMMKPFDSLPGPTLQEVFLDAMWAIKTLEDLHDFFREMVDFFKKPYEPSESEDEETGGEVDNMYLIDGLSPIGMFVRRTYLEFVRLQFDDTAKLWVSFVKYRQPTDTKWQKLPDLRRLDPTFAELGVQGDSIMPAILYGRLLDQGHDELDLSTHEIDRMLEFQLEKLQSMFIRLSHGSLTCAGYGDRLPDAVRDECRSMLQKAAAVPTVIHFIKFFDAWRAGNYTMAFESLHRYFDYTMHTRQRSYYQYALLHMAIMQADFGCYSEAAAAMTETIATARENQDLACMNFSLSWLQHLARAYPAQMNVVGDTALAAERYGLQYLKFKAKEMKLPSLLCSSLLTEAKMALSSGDSISTAFERLQQAAHVNVMYNMQNSYGIGLLLTGAAYGRLGFNHLTEAYIDLLLDCFGHCTPLEDILRASCRIAYGAVQCGEYPRAFGIIDKLQPLVHRNVRSCQYLITYSGLLKLKRALRRNDLAVASYLLTQLKTSSPSAIVDLDLSFQISLQRIDYLQRTGSFDSAWDAIEDLAAQLRADDADVYQRIHVMLLKALLCAKIGRPQKGFTVAMRAARAAWQAKLVPALWEAWGAVANILGALREYDAERRVLAAILPQAIGSGDLALCAQLYSWQSDAYMGLAGLEGTNKAGLTPAALSLVCRAGKYVDLSMAMYVRIKDVRGQCEMYFKKSAIAKARGDSHLADDWARRYLALYNAHTASNDADQD